MSELTAAGHDVIAIGSRDKYALQLNAEGFFLKTISFNQVSINPLREILTVFELRRTLKEEGVDIILSWTPKGNVYSALALIGLGKQLVLNISGLGRAFLNKGALMLVVLLLLKFALARASIVYFQNPDDRRLFLSKRLVDEARSLLLPGSGVDLTYFQPRPPRVADGHMNILMVSRLLWSKGLREFIDAARFLKNQDPSWNFQLIGALDDSDSSGVLQREIQSWISEGVIHYLGASDDVRDALTYADCVVLPSYREGLPRSMLEAAAMSRPILTTDVPGCRECVDEGVNGYLFKVKDTGDLVRALLTFKQLDPCSRIAMGAAGRRKVEREFDEKIVIKSYLTVIAKLGCIKIGFSG